MPERGTPEKAAASPAQRFAQHVARTPRPEAAKQQPKPRGRPRPKPYYDRDGNPLCIKCRQPNDPRHPASPYCVKHRGEQTAKTQKESRARKKVGALMVETIARNDRHRLADDFYSGPDGIALLPPKANDLLASLGGLLSALNEVSAATDGFVLKPKQTPSYYLRQVVVLKDAIEDLNAVLGPVLRRPR